MAKHTVNPAAAQGEAPGEPAPPPDRTAESLPLTPSGTLDLAAVDEQATREAYARLWPGGNDGLPGLPDTPEGRAAAEAIGRARLDAVNAARAAWVKRPGVKVAELPPRPKTLEEKLADEAWQRFAGRDAPDWWEQQRMLLGLPQDIRQRLEELRESRGGLWDFHAELANLCEQQITTKQASKGTGGKRRRRAALDKKTVPLTVK
ncbi:MAG: hypothetical protein GX591_09350, partial [Planctomycetes bacterium]|nr:hypothetical protein [Planctomycetota bacterium]